MQYSEVRTDKLLTDNGGEFATAEFLEMYEAMNITVKVTAAESPFSNSLVEKHDFSITDMTDETIEELQFSLDLALSCCLNAKNSLTKVHGFSPFQLALVQNPKLQSTYIDKPPALAPSDTCKILTDNLAALHKAREAFISCENSEKIKRALSNNIRTSRDTKYVSGDSAYFKRTNDKRWRGPGKVLQQDGQQVLVKNGNHYVRVHLCRLSLTGSTIIG